MKTLRKTLRDTQGTALLEVLISALLVSVVVVTLAIAFPQVTKNTLINQQRMMATQLVSDALTNLKSQPYSYLDPTDLSAFPGDASCNCGSAPTLTSQDSAVDGTTFHLTSCVNYVVPSTGSITTSQCPNAGDTGYKQIVVRVSWTRNTQVLTQTQEAWVTRF